MLISQILESIAAPSGIVTAYHGGTGFKGGFDLSLSGTGEGLRALGPGVYFTTNKTAAIGYASKYAKGEPTVYTATVDTTGFHNFSTQLSDEELARWEPIAIEMGYPSFGKIPSARQGIKNGWHQVGWVVEQLGDDKARALFIQHGIRGVMERIGGGNTWEICVFDMQVVHISNREPAV